MSAGRLVLSLVNRALRPANLRLDTSTRDRLELARLQTLAHAGYFSTPVFPVPSGFPSAPPPFVLDGLVRCADRFASFRDAAANDVGYTFDNPYFTSPDAEVLYLLVREFKPSRIVEVGSGNSTRLFRQAILDGRLDTRLTSIDPSPRCLIEGFADEVVAQPVENLRDLSVFRALGPNDILFIDSSHVVAPGTDAVFLYLKVLPLVAPGVLVHVHDVYLPYEYPQEWVIGNRWGWNEQYLVQVMLMAGQAFDVLWPGHFLQRTWPEFASRFPHLAGRAAGSLWLRRTAQRGDQTLEVME